jgi:hypothetical protein
MTTNSMNNDTCHESCQVPRNVYRMKKRLPADESPLKALIYNRRNELGSPRGKALTNEEIGEIIGVDASTVSNWATGRRQSVSPQLMAPLAKFLQISVSDLVAILSGSHQTRRAPAFGKEGKGKGTA